MTEELNWNELWDPDEKRYRVQTRDGRKVRVYTINGMDSTRPVVGEVMNLDCIPAIMRWRMSGHARDRKALDLIPEPRTVRRWTNVYKRPGGTYFSRNLWESEAIAKTAANDTEVKEFYIATVPVEWQE